MAKTKYTLKKSCRDWNHSFTITTKRCKHKHCSRCGICQCENGCLQIIKKND